MHVAFLPKWYPGGTDPQLGVFIRKQALALAELARVSVLVVRSRKDQTEAFAVERQEQEGVWEVHVSYRPSNAGLPMLRRGVNALRYRKAVDQAWRLMVEERGTPDTLHAHVLVRAVWAAYRIHRRLGIPYVVSEHSSAFLDDTFDRRPAPVKWVARWVMRRAARCLVVSPHLGDALVRRGLCRAYTVVPNVLPMNDLPLRPRGPFDRFLMVADLVDRIKNISGVLRALRIASDKGVTLQLDVVGGGPDREMLMALAERLGLNAQVNFHGRKDNAEVLALMADTGTVVVNSTMETFSVVTGEALCAGKPVIATRCGGPEAFVHAGNGMLVDVGDDEGLADAMVHMYREHERYDPAAIRQGVAEGFSATAIGRQLHRIHSEVLAHGA